MWAGSAPDRALSYPDAMLEGVCLEMRWTGAKTSRQRWWKAMSRGCYGVEADSTTVYDRAEVQGRTARRARRQSCSQAGKLGPRPQEPQSHRRKISAEDPPAFVAPFTTHSLSIHPPFTSPLSSSFLSAHPFSATLTAPSLLAMACPSRLPLALRRARCAANTFHRASRTRPAAQSQVRWTGSTAASTEPHQPDAGDGVRGKTAPAKTIKYTSESYNAPLPTTTTTDRAAKQGPAIPRSSVTSDSPR